jgi:hypothetical protein
MPLTRANVENYLVVTLGGKLTFVGFSVARTGNNPDLAMPMAMAYTTLGYQPVDFSDISDVDVGLIRVKDTPVFFGLSELFALRAIWGKMTDVTESAQGRSQAWSTMSGEILTRIAALEALYKTYLQSLRPIVTGTLTIPARPSSMFRSEM